MGSRRVQIAHRQISHKDDSNQAVETATIESNLDALSTGLGSGALDLTSLGLLDVVGGDPVRIVGGSGGNSGIRRRNIEVGLLDSDTSLLRLATTSLLGEVGGDPDGVEKVEDTGKEGEDEEVEEDTEMN